MTSEEFSLHQAYLALTASGPDAAMQRWAQHMAATLNGPLVRRDKRKFKPDDFWPADPWAAHDEAPPPLPDKPGAKPARLAPDFSHLRGMRVGNRRR